MRPTATFELPDWDESSRSSWTELVARASRQRRDAGGGRTFTVLMDEIRTAIDRGEIDTIVSRLHERRVARALVSVWTHDVERARVSMTPDLVTSVVERQDPHPTRMLVRALVDLLLRHFDLLDTWTAGLFDATSEATRRAASLTPPARGRLLLADVADTARDRPEEILARSAPRRVAELLIQSGADGVPRPLDDWIRERGLYGYDSGRFGLLVRQSVYLEQVARADHTAPAQLGFLEEITTKRVIDAPGTGGLFFGHDVLEAMTAKTGGAPCDEWLEALVAVGGDPRLQRSSQWNRWWEPLPLAAREKAVRWMSVEDLRLFLEAVDTYARDNRKEDMLRMFPARKQFLWGLYTQGLVRESRVILGNRARASVQRQLGRLRTDVSSLTARSDTAIVVLDCGTFHLVEGSHSFKLWIFDGPARPILTDRSRRTFTPEMLTYTVPRDHAEHHRAGNRAHVSITHHESTWQHHAVRYLVEELGVNLDPRSVMSADDYHRLKRRFGLPVVGARPVTR
jgi:hypothetical protein